jgi:wobble nucleotide-excising tRNase
VLLRLDLLAEIGRFKSLRHKAPQFSKLSLIYGRNAQGKSTICAVLGSAALSSPQIIATRKRLGATGEPRAVLEWAALGTVEFNCESWNSSPGPIYIFDQDYVERNVHVAGSVTRDNKRQLLQIIIGQRGVDLARQISNADTEIKATVGRVAELERAIRLAHPVISDVATFCSFAIPENIDAQIVSATKALNSARQATAVLQRKAPRAIEMMTLDAYDQILASSIAGISRAAAQRVADHIQQHGMEVHGERWIKYGIDHMVGENCPFCSQSIEDVDLIGAFRDFFSEAYSEHTRQVEEAGQSLWALKEGPMGIEGVLSQNEADLVFWNEVSELPFLPELEEEQIAKIDKGIALLCERFDKKAASPFSQLKLGPEREKIEDACECLRAYNNEVRKCLHEIERARREIQQADPNKAEAVLNSKKALQAKAAAPLVDETAEYLALAPKRRELNARKADLQEELRAYAATTLSVRQREINELLMLFGANFQIVDAKAGFVGREANTEYGIELGAHVLRVGMGSQSGPNFKTVLSAGDKFTLALALFFTQVRSDRALNNAVVVFDDPFSSQDMQRQWETGSQIRQLADDACQVIVLSHDPRFLYLIEKDANLSICSTFQLMFENDSEAAIKKWSASDELKSNYLRQAERIRHLASNGQFLSDTSAENLIKDLRPFLEDFIKQRFPGRFDALKMLDAMTDEIEAAGSSDPLFKDVANIRAVNEYTRANHHGGASRPDVDALRAQCRRVGLILGHY